MNTKQLIAKVRRIKKEKVIYPFFTFLTLIFFAGVMYHALGFLTTNISKTLDPVKPDETDLHVGDAKLVVVLQRLNIASTTNQSLTASSTGVSTIPNIGTTTLANTPTTTPIIVASSTTGIATTTASSTDEEDN